MAITFKSVLNKLGKFQPKTITAGTTSTIVTPDVGYNGLSSVTVNPEIHTGTYTPSAISAQNDMGEHHAYRYVDTSGMAKPSGNKSLYYVSNGKYSNIDVNNYATVSVEVEVTPMAVSTLLWENSDRESAFVESAITLSDDATNYDYLTLEYIASLNKRTIIDAFFSWQDEETWEKGGVIGSHSVSSSYSEGYVRFYFLDENSSTRKRVYFEDCYFIDYKTATKPTIANDHYIPIRIYGWKYN